MASKVSEEKGAEREAEPKLEGGAPPTTNERAAPKAKEEGRERSATKAKATSAAYLRSRTGMPNKAAFQFMPGQKHSKGIRPPGCPCCDPDSLEAEMDRLLE